LPRAEMGNFRQSQVRKGDRPSASRQNALIAEVERLSHIASQGGFSYVDNSTGMYVLPSTSRTGIFKLTEDLTRSTSATAYQMRWDGEESEYVEDETTEKTLYGAPFWSGYGFKGQIVRAEFRSESG